MGAFGWGPQPTSVLVFEVLLLLLLLLLLVLDVVEVFMGGNGHTGDQQHHLGEADLRILVDIKVLHDFVNGGPVFHELQRKGLGEGEVLSFTAQACPWLLWDPHSCWAPNSLVLCVAPSSCHHHHCFGYSNDSPMAMKQSESNRLASLQGHHAMWRPMKAAVLCQPQTSPLTCWIKNTLPSALAK